MRCLDYYHLDKKYRMSFCLYVSKIYGTKTISFGDKVIIEGII